LSAADGSRFCSAECVNAWRRTVRGNAHPLKKQNIEMTCEQCGGTYYCKPSIAIRSRFCSRQCQGAWTTCNSGKSETSIERAIASLLSDMKTPHIAQKPMGPFVCDFALLLHRVVIECDGDYWHGNLKQIHKDLVKDGWLKSHGYQVVRLPEHRINADLEWCRRQIKNAIRRASRK
jgi:very-short-patch-repair endonuclease